jgi:hypothetical protein
VPLAAATNPVTVEKIITPTDGTAGLPVATIADVRHPPALMMKSVSAETISVPHFWLFMTAPDCRL